MSSAAPTLRCTPEEYLARERRSEIKHEYWNGFVYAMAGASREHSLIASNLIREIGSQLRDRPCETHGGDLRVCVETTGLYTYPDVTVVCERPRFLEGTFDTLVNPTVIVEILSPSTEVDDRGRKFAHYRRIASLREYVLVAQDRPLIERYRRQGEEWVLSECNRLDDELRLESIGCRIPLREVYARVEVADTAVPTEPPAP
jgi:Uma2 family endonuclease